MDLVSSVPRMSQEDFESILNSNMQVRVRIRKKEIKKEVEKK